VFIILLIKEIDDLYKLWKHMLFKVIIEIGRVIPLLYGKSLMECNGFS
jgi:hypothetical protein